VIRGKVYVLGDCQKRGSSRFDNFASIFLLGLAESRALPTLPCHLEKGAMTASLSIVCKNRFQGREDRRVCRIEWEGEGHHVGFKGV
jgi:hypothetical protein